VRHLWRVGGGMTVFSFFDLMRSLPCTYCNAKAGENCRTKSGRRKREFHADRFYAAKQAQNTTEGATE
jgi:hypothetical protein